jgi:hypothetical protein
VKEETKMPASDLIPIVSIPLFVLTVLLIYCQFSRRSTEEYRKHREAQKLQRKAVKYLDRCDPVKYEDYLEIQKITEKLNPQSVSREEMIKSGVVVFQNGQYVMTPQLHDAVRNRLLTATYEDEKWLRRYPHNFFERNHLAILLPSIGLLSLFLVQLIDSPPRSFSYSLQALLGLSFLASILLFPLVWFLRGMET